MPYFIFFLASSIALTLFSHDIYNEAFGILTALSVSLIVIVFASKTSFKSTNYLLFFSISVTSLFGLTEVLTGSHATSSNFIFYGLSFYTASIAYLNSKKKLTIIDSLKVSNPLLLFTGPLALFVTRISHRRLTKRIRYFLPFLTIGIFYFQVIGAPLSAYMFLINATDLVSSLTFAIIFEIFVYANFCGLSLIVYALAGIFGYRIPLNFRQPFSALNLVDFWKGWHISLSTVLKELFYTPARKAIGSFSALFLVFLSSAMWHGITFNFILWGMFHATLFYLTVKILKSAGYLKFFITLPLMILGIVIGRLIFADSDTTRLLEKLRFEYDGLSAILQLLSAPSASKNALLLGVCSLLIEFLLRNKKFVKKRNYKHLRVPLAQFFLLGSIVLLTMNVGGDYAIYGQR
jgi:alginate O-acetyltransferase complex protein AlgI